MLKASLMGLKNCQHKRTSGSAGSALTSTNISMALVSGSDCQQQNNLVLSGTYKTKKLSTNLMWMTSMYNHAQFEAEVCKFN